MARIGRGFVAHVSEKYFLPVSARVVLSVKASAR